MLRYVLSRDTHAIYKHSINGKGHLLLLFALLPLSTWILKGSSWTDRNACRTLAQRPTACNISPGLIPAHERHINLSEFSKPSVEFAPFWNYIQYPKAIHHCQNALPTSHSGISMTILALVFALCKNNGFR